MMMMMKYKTVSVLQFHVLYLYVLYFHVLLFHVQQYHVRHFQRPQRNKEPIK